MLTSNLKILIVDPFVQEPAMNCTNRLSHEINSRIQIFYPSVFTSPRPQDFSPDAVLILGSASHVTQKLPWHRPLAENIHEVLESKIPVMGFCFGHQLMANFYGCEVDYIKDTETRENQSRVISFVSDFSDIKKNETLELAVTHRQVVKTITPDFLQMAKGPQEFLKYDIIMHKKLPFMGTQAHPEASAYFCKKSAQLNDNKIAKVQADGARLIHNFFKYYFR